MGSTANPSTWGKMFYEIVRAAYLGESYRLGSMVFNLSPHIVCPFDFSRRTKPADEYGCLISNLNKRFAAILATFLGVSIILIIVGPASQLVIPFLRVLASGSKEQGILLVMIALTCLFGVILLLRSNEKGASLESTGIQVKVMGDMNVVKVGNMEIKAFPPIQPATNAKVSNLTVKPSVFLRGSIKLGGQVNDLRGNPAPYALVQFFTFDGKHWSPYQSPFPSGSDGSFLVDIAPTPPIAFMPIVTGYVDAQLIGEQAGKDRKKDAVERRLENLLSPLFEILTRARFENTERNSIRQEPFKEGPRDYVFNEHELKRVHEIIERFGHYLDRTELSRLKMALQKYDTVIPSYPPDQGPTTWYRFWNGDLDPHRDYLEKKREELRKELQKLTGLD